MLDYMRGHRLNYLYVLNIWTTIKKDNAHINNVEQVLIDRKSTNVHAIMARLRSPTVFGGISDALERRKRIEENIMLEMNCVNAEV